MCIVLKNYVRRNKAMIQANANTVSNDGVKQRNYEACKRGSYDCAFVLLRNYCPIKYGHAISLAAILLGPERATSAAGRAERLHAPAAAREMLRIPRTRG